MQARHRQTTKTKQAIKRTGFRGVAPHVHHNTGFQGRKSGAEKGSKGWSGEGNNIEHHENAINPTNPDKPAGFISATAARHLDPGRGE